MPPAREGRRLLWMAVSGDGNGWHEFINIVGCFLGDGAKKSPPWLGWAVWVVDV